MRIATPPPAPHPALEACVVVPARDEEERIAACVAALGGQTGLRPEAWEVLLVLDACRDRTLERALEAAAAHSQMSLRLLTGPGRGSGGARATGMNAACARLHAVGRPRGLIASTDADTRVAPDWLVTQLELAGGGVRAIGGRIELCPVEREELAAGVLDGHGRQSRTRFVRVLEQVAGGPEVTDHWQFSGASMSLTAETYAEVGGLGQSIHSEDEHLERLLVERGVPIERHLGVKVTTSARLDGRATHGLARLLRELSGP